MTRSARAIVGAGGAAFAVLSIPLLAGLTYAGVDFARTDMGYLCELQRAGSLWLAPHLGNGQPLFADPQFQLLYPPRWLGAAFAPDLGSSIAAILQLAIGAAGAAWLMRSYGVRALGAACFGFAFAFTGTALNLIVHAAYLTGVAWLPWAWVAGRRILQGAGARSIRLALFVALSMLLLGGEPQSFAVALGALAVEAGIRLARPAARRRAVGALGRVAALCAASIGVGLVQWLPAFAELALTSRGQLDARELFRWSFRPSLWLGAILPGVTEQRVAPGTSLWLLWSGQQSQAPWNATPYLGALLLVAAALGLRDRRAWPAGAIGLVGLFLALGDTLPILPMVVKLVPALGVFRYPAKLLLVVSLAACVCAALAGQRAARRPRAFAILGIVALGGLAAAAGWALGGGLDTWAASVANPEALGRPLPQLSSVVFHAAIRGAAPLAIALLLVVWRGRASSAIPLLITADLLLSAPTAVFVGPRLEGVTSPFAAIADPAAVLCQSPAIFRFRMRSKDQDRLWAESMTLRTVAAPNLNACEAITSGVSYSVMQTRVNARLERALPEGKAGAARAMGCSHFAASSPLSEEPARNVPMALGGPFAQVIELQDPIPAAFVVARPQRVASEPQLIEAVIAAASAQAALSLVDDPLKALPAERLLPAADGVALGTVEAASPDRARLSLTGSGPAVVGVRRSFQAGWSATQAGRLLPVIRAAGTQLAVLVDDVAAGPVELAYRPPRLGLGMAAGIAGLLLALGAISLPQRKSRRENTTTAAVRNAPT